MACGSCGGSARRIQQQAQAAVSTTNSTGRSRPSYTVIAPDPADNKTFDNYPDATAYKRKVNGTLTTST